MDLDTVDQKLLLTVVLKEPHPIHFKCWTMCREGT
jgi:hypothetical protein